MHQGQGLGSRGYGPELSDAMPGGTRGSGWLPVGVLQQGRPGEGAPASPRGWHCTEAAWLGPQLLGEGREHAEVGKVFDVIVAGALGGVPRHGQHVLEHFSLTGLLVGVLLTALLAVVLALPL